MVHTVAIVSTDLQWCQWRRMDGGVTTGALCAKKKKQEKKGSRTKKLGDALKAYVVCCAILLHVLVLLF